MIEETIGTLHLGPSDADALCLLAKVRTVGTQEFLIPLGRSYDANEWETLPPHFYSFTPLDSDTTMMDITDLEGNEVLHLFRFTHSLSVEEQVSRFLAKVTFGPTKADITSFIGTGMTEASFIRQQMDLPPSYHREVYRRRANGMAVKHENAGIPDQACESDTRWRKNAFVNDDRRKSAVFTPTSGGYYLFSIDGVPTTEFNGLPQTIFREGSVDFEEVNITSTFSLEWTLGQFVGGDVWIKDEKWSSPRFLVGGNPEVMFPNGDDIEGVVVLDLSADERDDFAVVNEKITFGDELVSLGNLSDPTCANLSRFDYTTLVIADLGNGTYARYEASVKIEENTIESPIYDGGGSIQLNDASRYYCSNVPRTYLNEDSCVLSTAATACRIDSDVFTTGSYERRLDETLLEAIHDATGLYIYAVQDLRLPATFEETEEPCYEGVRTRWVRVEDLPDTENCEGVVGGFPDDATRDTIADLLRSAWNVKSNTYVLDIKGPGLKEGVCGNGTLPGTRVEVRNRCFMNVHEDYWSVFDFSTWAAPKNMSEGAHPGNRGKAPNPITRFADPDDTDDEPTFFLDYPGWHPMSRWEMNHVNFEEIGRFEDVIQYGDLPDYLRNDIAVAELFGLNATLGVSEQTVVCGSRGEVGQDRTQDDLFRFNTDAKSANYRQRPAQVHRAALEYNDQLRQRVAWALNQIFVVSIGDVDIGSRVEVMSHYYDNFVQNAFGSYRDIMKAVAYSPLMGEMLSYEGSRSTQLLYEWTGDIVYPDENFAREIMQLFTIGLTKLNQDGTPITEEDGVTPAQTYDIADIVSGARMWTGFDHYPRRGNTENSQFSANRIDQMKLIANYRDRFPKMNLHDGYIGDGYPQCGDLPEKAFLRKGAKFRVLGASPRPEMQYERSDWQRNPNVQRLELSDSGTDVSLYDMLCAKDG